MKLNLIQEAISVPGPVKRPIAESLDFRSIGTILNVLCYLCFINVFLSLTLLVSNFFCAVFYYLMTQS